MFLKLPLQHPCSQLDTICWSIIRWVWRESDEWGNKHAAQKRRVVRQMLDYYDGVCELRAVTLIQLPKLRACSLPPVSSIVKKFWQMSKDHVYGNETLNHPSGIILNPRILWIDWKNLTFCSSKEKMPFATVFGPYYLWSFGFVTFSCSRWCTMMRIISIKTTFGKNVDQDS